MARRKQLSTEGLEWERRKDIAGTRLRITEETVEKVLDEMPMLHFFGVGYEAFGPLARGERLDALARSRLKLLTDSFDDLREVCKFMKVLGTQSKLSATSPTAFWLAHLYKALAKNGDWTPPEVAPGVIICAAKILRLQVTSSAITRPDARINLSTDKCLAMHKFALRTGLYGIPMYDNPPGARRRKTIQNPVVGPGDISYWKNTLAALYDKKGNGINTVVPPEDFEKFNVPENQENDDPVDA